MPEGFEVNNFDHLEEAQSSAAYGIYDTQDNCWIGDDVGPRVFTRVDSEKMKGMPQELIARISAQVTGVQLGFAPGRLRAVEFNGEDLQ